MKKTLFAVLAFIVFALYSCRKSSEDTNANSLLIGKYTLIKNKLHFQDNGRDYYDSIVANLGYLNLSSNDTAYVKSIWNYNTSNPNNIIKDTNHLMYDTFKYTISGTTISFFKSNTVVATANVSNNQFVIHRITSNSPLYEDWNYFSK